MPFKMTLIRNRLWGFWRTTVGLGTILLSMFVPCHTSSHVSMLVFLLLSLVLLVLLLSRVHAWHALPPRSARGSMLSMHFEEADLEISLKPRQLSRDRYIATNRFQVRPGKGPAFEKRWADRESRLASLKGFRFFTLLKRVDEEGTTNYDNDLGNYISYTIWKDKDDFNAWRTGDAFKEAHSGKGRFGKISGFVYVMVERLSSPGAKGTIHFFVINRSKTDITLTTTIVTSLFTRRQLISTALFIIKSSPKPAFYDGLIFDKKQFKFKPPAHLVASKIEGGWRKLEADGQNELPTDVFVSQEQYTVTEEETFENVIKKEFESENVDDNLATFSLQRRDVDIADDGINYIVSRVWSSKDAYLAWRNTVANTAAITATKAELKGTALYEGKLAIFSDAGP